MLSLSLFVTSIQHSLTLLILYERLAALCCVRGKMRRVTKICWGGSKSSLLKKPKKVLASTTLFFITLGLDEIKPPHFFLLPRARAATMYWVVVISWVVVRSSLYVYV